MACSSCRLAEVWLLLLVFLIAAASGASFTSYPRTQGEEEEEIKKAMAVPTGQIKKVGDANNGSSSSSSSPSSSPSPAGASNGNKQSKEKPGCVTTKECHMKRLVCAKKCTIAAHRKCAAKCSRACSSYPICSSTLMHLPFP